MKEDAFTINKDSMLAVQKIVDGLRREDIALRMVRSALLVVVVVARDVGGRSFTMKG